MLNVSVTLSEALARQRLLCVFCVRVHVRPIGWLITLTEEQNRRPPAGPDKELQTRVMTEEPNVNLSRR